MTTRTKIYFTNETEQRVPRKVRTLIKCAVISSLEYEGFCNSAEVSVTFTDNEGIRALNSQYRGIDKETDVLSFPLTDYEATDVPPAEEISRPSTSRPYPWVILSSLLKRRESRRQSSVTRMSARWRSCACTRCSICSDTIT